MTDLATADLATPSTVIDTDTSASPSGGGAPRVLPEAEKPETKTLRDTITDVVKDESKEEAPAAEDKAADADKSKAAPEKGAEKPAEAKEPAEPKEAPKAPERAPDGKFAAKEQETEPQAKTGEHSEPPKQFLPDAKEVWRNVPRAVKRDMETAFRDHEQEVTRYREAAERYEPLRQFDEAVRQSGRAGLHETLAEVAQLEDMMGKNPIAALNQVLLRAGPRKPDGQPYSLFELASAIVQSGQDNYQKVVAQQPAQQEPKEDPRVRQLEQKLAAMQEQQLAATVIEPFKREHPRYDELQGDIAFFLQSGKIPSSLSPHEKLAVAYDMAVRINPASQVESPAANADPEPGHRADDVLSGGKSIKSAPGAVTPDMEPERSGSIRDLLESELKRAKRS